MQENFEAMQKVKIELINQTNIAERQKMQEELNAEMQRQ